MPERLKSLPLLASVLALVYIIAKDWFGWDIPAWTDITTEILAIAAILFGVANNPTDRQNF